MSKCKCHDKLTEAKAELAYLKALPSSAFQTTIRNGIIINHSIDNQLYAVQMAHAKVKRLQILAKSQVKE